MALTEEGFRRQPFRCKRLTRDEIEVLIVAAEQLDEFYREAEGRPDSDLRNSMGSDLREIVENDRIDQ